MVYMICELLQIIEIMGDRVGVPMKVAVKRDKDNLVTLTVIPEESKSDMWQTTTLLFKTYTLVRSFALPVIMEKTNVH